MDITQLDRSLLLAINGFARHSDLLDKTVVQLLYDDFLKGGFFFVFIWWLWFRDSENGLQDRIAVFRIAVGLFMALVVARAMQVLLPGRVRPIHEATLHLAIPFTGTQDTLEHWSSFPSDHAVVFFAMATAIWVRYRWLGFLAFAWVAIFACLPRVYVGFHYPSDILAGAVLGIIMMLFAERAPLPSIATAVINRVFLWERRRPQIFYCTAVIVTFELMVLCNDFRLIGRAIAQAL
jgi:undecaprenyl-diphosphatase